jgi:hypothetical protein
MCTLPITDNSTFIYIYIYIYIYRERERERESIICNINMAVLQSSEACQSVQMSDNGASNVLLGVSFFLSLSLSFFLSFFLFVCKT